MSSESSGSLESAMKIVAQMMRIPGPCQNQFQLLFNMLMDHKKNISKEVLDLRMGCLMLKGDRESVEREKFVLQDELDKCMRECLMLKGGKESVERQKFVVQDELGKCRSECLMLKGDKESVEREKFAVQEELEKCQSECRGLKEELASLREGERMWRDRVKWEEIKSESRLIECTGLKEELDGLREESRLWHDKVKWAEDEYAKYDVIISELNKKVSEMENAEKVLKHSMDEKCLALKRSKAVVGVEKLKLQGELKKCQKECEDLMKKLEKSREDERVAIESLRMAEDRYTKHYEEQSEITNEKDRIISEVNKKVSDIENLEVRRDLLKKECLSLERAIAYAGLEKLKLLDELETCMKECLDLKEKLTRSPEKERPPSEKLERVEDRCTKYYEKEKQPEITNEKDLVITRLNEKLAETESELQGLKDQKLAADQVIEELRQKHMEAGKRMEELMRQNLEPSETPAKLSSQLLMSEEMIVNLKHKLSEASHTIKEVKSRNVKASDVIEALRTQKLALEAEKISTDNIIDRMRRELLKADQTIKELKSQNSQASADSTDELRGLILAFEAEELRLDNTIKDLRRQQLEAVQTVEELRSRNADLSNVVKDLSNRILAFEADKLKADETIKKLRHVQLESDQTIEELRSQSSAACDMLEDIKKRILASEADKLMSDGKRDEIRRRQVEADQTTDELEINNIETFQATEKFRENFNARKKANTVNSPLSQGGDDGLTNGSLLGLTNIDGGVGVSAVPVVSSPFICSERACTGMQRTGSRDLPHKSSSTSQQEGNDNAESPPQADAQSCYNPQDESHCTNQGKESEKFCGSDPLEVLDSDEGSHVQSACNSDISANLGKKRRICELSSSQMVSSINFIPRRKTGLLPGGDVCIPNCSQQKEQILIPINERDRSPCDLSGRPSSCTEAISQLTRNPVVKICEVNAVTPFLSRSELGNFNSYDDEISVDSEDESSCSDSSIVNIVTGLRTHKFRKRTWMSRVDMLSDFLEDIEQCMNAVCVLYRHSISTREYSNRGLAHFEAMGGRALAEYLINGDPEHRLRKFVSEVREERPGVLDQCRRIAVDYGEKLFTIYCSGEDPLFKGTESEGPEVCSKPNN